MIPSDLAALTKLLFKSIKEDLRFRDLALISHGHSFVKTLFISVFVYNSLTLTSITKLTSDGITLCW